MSKHLGLFDQHACGYLTWEMRVQHDLLRSITIGTDDANVLHYDYRCEQPTTESPRPFIHPLRSLAGDTVTGFRPTDHPWHHGLSMTMAVLSEGNFWGGPSYVDPDGYTMKGNHGRIIHSDPVLPFLTDEAAGFSGSLGWIGPDGTPWLREERRILVPRIGDQADWYQVQFRASLTNLRSVALEFGSPTTEGRPNAGYGGLFWRGPRCFTGGEVFTESADGQDSAMGSHAPWLAFVGEHDESNNKTTLIFQDNPESVRYPTQWFVRSDPIPAVSFAFSFDSVLSLEPGVRLELSHRIIVANRGRGKNEVAEMTEAPW